MNLTRFSFARLGRWTAVLCLIATLEQCLPAQSAVPEPFTKQAMLRDIAGQVIAPRYQDLSVKCHALTNAIGDLAKTPDAATLEKARQSWVSVLLASSRLRCYKAGPIADRDFAPAFFYWQVLPAKIESLLSSPRAIDGTLLDELGVTCKGLFTLEYLLYGSKASQPNATNKNSPPLELLSGDGAKKRRDFMVLLAQDVDAKAGQLAVDWKASGDKAATIKFANGGQESINLIVNQLAMVLEDATEHRLRFALALREPLLPQLDRIEGSRSGTSLQSLVSTLEGAKELYRGGEKLGLDDSLKRINPALETRVENQFDTVIAAAKEINMPLEQAVFTNRVSLQNALDKTRALEVLFKVDVVSSLGVTLTFSSVDGD